jgi:hypothetical protein
MSRPPSWLRRRHIITAARMKGVADTVDIDRFLKVWFWHRPPARDPIEALINAALMMGHDNFTAVDAREIINASKRGRPLYAADQIGQYLRISNAERLAGQLWSIGAYDFSKRQRIMRRRQQTKERQSRWRLKRGAQPHTQSLRRTKPWEAEGISRTTWYERRRKRPEKNRTTGPIRNARAGPIRAHYSCRPTANKTVRRAERKQGGLPRGSFPSPHGRAARSEQADGGDRTMTANNADALLTVERARDGCPHDADEPSYTQRKVDWAFAASMAGLQDKPWYGVRDWGFPDLEVRSR